jgi:DNA-binding MarR family transcriptional regulator
MNELFHVCKRKEQYLFGSILLLANKIQILGDRLIEDISLKQWFLLIMIKNIPTKNPSITDISEYTGSTRQNVKQMLNILEKKGYIQVNKSTADGRALSISLSEKTEDYFEKNEALGDEILDKLFMGIDTGYYDSLINVINILFKNIENYK